MPDKDQQFFILDDSSIMLHKADDDADDGPGSYIAEFMKFGEVAKMGKYDVVYEHGAFDDYVGKAMPLVVDHDYGLKSHVGMGKLVLHEGGDRARVLGSYMDDPDGQKARSVVRMRQDIDGNGGDVSVGTHVLQHKIEQGKNGRITRRVLKARPYELSMVMVGSFDETSIVTNSAFEKHVAELQQETDDEEEKTDAGSLREDEETSEDEAPEEVKSSATGDSMTLAGHYDAALEGARVLKSYLLRQGKLADTRESSGRERLSLRHTSRLEAVDELFDDMGDMLTEIRGVSKVKHSESTDSDNKSVEETVETAEKEVETSSAVESGDKPPDEDTQLASLLRDQLSQSSRR